MTYDNMSESSYTTHHNKPINHNQYVSPDSSNQSTISTADSTPRLNYHTLHNNNSISSTTSPHDDDNKHSSHVINELTQSINTLHMSNNNTSDNGTLHHITSDTLLSPHIHISPNSSTGTHTMNTNNNININSQYRDHSGNDINCILLVSVINQQLPVSIENLYTIFRVYGIVNRIVTFKKQTYQALVEYNIIDDAVQAKFNLDGKDMFSNCNTLKLSYSQLKPPLRVRVGDEKSRDFTLDPIILQTNDTVNIPYTNINDTTNIHSTTRTSYSPQSNSPYSYPSQSCHINTQPQQSSPYDTTLQQHSPITSHYQTFAGGYIAPGEAQYHYNGTSAPGSVLLVNNLIPDIIDADKLFILFGVYGDVLRVKIMYANQSTALIQYVTPQQASIAQQNLDGITLYGSQLSVTLSKHNEVKLPAQHTQPIIKHDSNGESHQIILTKDYTNSPAHRFRWQNSKNARHVCAPTNSLHVSNLASNLTESDIYHYFNSELHPVINITLFTSNNKTMSFIRYPDISSATHALIDTHNTKLHGRYVKVTFSHRVESPQKLYATQSGSDDTQQSSYQLYNDNNNRYQSAPLNYISYDQENMHHDENGHTSETLVN